jgi:hypothetical protein
MASIYHTEAAERWSIDHSLHVSLRCYALSLSIFSYSNLKIFRYSIDANVATLTTRRWISLCYSPSHNDLFLQTGDWALLYKTKLLRNQNKWQSDGLIQVKFGRIFKAKLGSKTAVLPMTMMNKTVSCNIHCTVSFLKQRNRQWKLYVISRSDLTRTFSRPFRPTARSYEKKKNLHGLSPRDN